MAKILSFDSLKNFVANLGTGRDKASSSTYYDPTTDANELVNAYRGSWLPRKIVEIPAHDATRSWRSWQAERQQITAIEAEEKRLDVQRKVRDAMIKARLFGGAGIFIGVRGDKSLDLPLSAESIQRNGIEFLNVMSSRALQAGELETDPVSADYGKPKFYNITSNAGQLDIHPSRIVRFVGAELPDAQTTNIAGWGDSVLTAAWTACKNFDATMANIASLVFEAKVDILGIPGLTELMADPESRKLLIERVHLAAMLKSNNGMLITDSEEEHSSKSYSFSGLDKIADLFSQSGSGAADVPMTRLFGQSPGGLNSSGESDLRNYYDNIKSRQELDMRASMSILDECVIRSALGSRPAEIFYTWNSLWQTTEKERADIGKTTADTIKTLADSNLFNADVLSRASENLLIERAVLPGLEAAIEEFGGGAQNDDPNAV